MAKSVFHYDEVKSVDDRVMLRLMRNYQPEPEEIEAEDIPEYTGPTADDLRREAMEFKAQWEAEKDRMLQQAQESADAILKKAEDAAMEEVNRQTEQADSIRADAESKADAILSETRAQAEDIVNKAKAEQEDIKKAAHDEGFKAGCEEGFQEGNQEAKRLVDRLHTVIERVLGKRQAILEETEQQVVELVLLMTRKVVKAVTESQRDVVISNAAQALRKVKDRGDVTIRVNLDDVQLTTEHADEFMKIVESVKNITIIEDSTVDRGGCIVETDFGAIDARISSQLNELEQKILEISPIKSIHKPDKPAVFMEEG
ncbi:MAG: flagellar assembly protein FliH [Treponemataceae bacterium]|nr:MAG: flagellar assembly protein FliH [Treponemataceae bacterium]